LQRFFELFCSGCIFGLIYRASGSLVLVAILHSVSDVLFAVSPIIATPLPRVGQLWAEFVVLLTILNWARLCRRTAIN